MRLYLAGVLEKTSILTEEETKNYLTNRNILLSFAYWNERFEQYTDLPRHLIIDSGGFTFKHSVKNFDRETLMEYAKKYAEFLKRFNVKEYFELDVEELWGIEAYKDCLHFLQDKTGIEPIYIMHAHRGLEWWKMICKKVPYVAIAVRHFNDEQNKYLLDYAHSCGCRVHGLAQTNVDKLFWLNYDSVDSSTWSAGPRFSTKQLFDGHRIIKENQFRTDEIQVSNVKMSSHCIKEWLKLSEYFYKEMEPIW